MKNMIIEHTTFLEIILKEEDYFENFFDNVNTVNQLINKIKKESQNYKKFNIIDSYKMEGDLFEIFGEIYFKLFGSVANAACGIANYKPVPPIEDNGVDGFGIGVDNKPATVQIKFRSNVEKNLLERDIKQFGYQSIIKYNVDKNTKHNMVIFTTASGLHWYTESNIFLGKMRVIGLHEIKKMINNNSCFWINVMEIIKNSKEKLIV